MGCPGILRVGLREGRLKQRGCWRQGSLPGAVPTVQQVSWAGVEMVVGLITTQDSQVLSVATYRQALAPSPPRHGAGCL